MGGVLGVKETKEALLALALLGKAVADVAKDGLQLNDAVVLGAKLVGDEAFRNALQEGVKGADLIDNELGELDFADVLELSKVVPEILAKFKKD